MTLQALKNLNKQQQENPAKNQPSFVHTMLEKHKGTIQSALPQHINAERMVRTAQTLYRLTPSLKDCQPETILATVVQAAQLGLDFALNEAYLIPYSKKGSAVKKCQLIVSYTGLIKLARQSGYVEDIYAHEVRAKDKFRLTLGLDRNLIHEPLMDESGFPAGEEERGNVTGFYAVALLKGGTRAFVAMSRKEVERVRDGSDGYKASKKFDKRSTWDTDFIAMGIKTAFRRLCKYLPKSPELSTALMLDSLASRGRDQRIDLHEAAKGALVVNEFEEGEEEIQDADFEDSSVHELHTEKTSVDGEISRAQMAAIAKMRRAKTLEALDEIYIVFEPEFSSDELKVLQEEYRLVKHGIEMQ